MTDKNGFLYKVINTFETSPRSQRHNNYGAHIWTPELEERYGAQRGDPLPDNPNLFTAYYDNPETGTQASNFIIDNIWERSGGDSMKFASIYTGLPETSPTVQNYASMIKQNKSQQDWAGAIERSDNRNNLLKRKEELHAEFPEQEKEVDKLIETGLYSADGIRDQISKVKASVQKFDYDQFKSDVMTSLDISQDEVEGAKNAFLRGYGNLKTMTNVLGYQLGIDPEERVKQIAIEQSGLEDKPASETFERAMNPDNDFGQTLKEMKADPIAVATQLTIESFVQFLPVGFAVGLPLGIATAIVGAPAWLPVTLATSSGIASLGIEWSSEILNSFSQQGVNVKDPDELVEAFTNPEINAKAKREALEKGVPVAVVDALSGGVAGRHLKMARGMGLTKGITAVGKEILEQAGLGGTGEFVGQAVALDPEEGEVFNVPAIVAESIVEIGTGGVAGTVRLTFDNGNTIEVPDNDPLVQDISSARLDQEQQPVNKTQEDQKRRVDNLSKYKGQINIGFTDAPVVDVFTEEEVRQAQYNPETRKEDLIKKGETGYVDDGVNRYRFSIPAQNYEFGDGTRRIVLGEDATQADFLEDTAEAIYTRVGEVNPELASDIDLWIEGVVNEAQLNNETLAYNGAELFSKSFMNEMGFIETSLPSYAKLPENITKGVLGEMQLDDGSNLVDGIIPTEPIIMDEPVVEAEPTPEPVVEPEPVVKAEPTPTPEPTSEPVAVEEKPTKTKEAKGLQVEELNTNSIVIDENKFQPREEYNQQMIDDIAGNFDPVKWDEPILWKDPKDSKLYVVSGHHRQLGVIKGRVDNATYKILPEGTTLEQARDYSEIGNLARTEQTTFENASVVRRRIDRGDSFVQINKDLPSISVGKAKSLYNLSFLDSKGKFKDNYENTSGFKRIVSTASLVGGYRKKYDWMTNKHEDDIFTYLYNENAIEGDDQKIGLNLSMTLEKVDGMKDRPSSILKQLRKDTARLPEDADETTKNEVDALDNQISSITAQLEDTKSLSEEAKKIAEETNAKETDVYETLRKDLQSQRRDVKKQKQELIESLNQEDPNQDSLFSLRGINEKEYAKAFNKKVTRQERRNAKRDAKVNAVKQFRDYFRTISSQLNRINPKITERLRRSQKRAFDILDKYLVAVKPFGKTLRRMQKKARTRRAKAEYVALKLALYNGDTATVESILKTKRRINQYREFVRSHEALHEQAMAVGIDMGHIENHFPRTVVDHRAFYKYVSGQTATSRRSKLEEAFASAREYRGRDLTDEEKVAIANALLRDKKGLLSNTADWSKTRKIDKLTVDQLRFYDEPHNSLAMYANGMSQMIATAQFMGGRPNRFSFRKFPKNTRIKGVGIYDNKIGQFEQNEQNNLLVFESRNTPKAIQAMEVKRKEEQLRTGLPYVGLQDQIGSMLIDLESDFKLNRDEVERVRTILEAYYNDQTMNSFVAGVRNVGYISTMGSVFSAVTQLGDLGVSVYRSAKGSAIGLLRPSTYTRVISEMFKSLTRLNKYKLKQLGVDNRILQELSDNQTSLQRAMTWVFRLSGLSTMDRVGKETFINTSMKKYEKGASQIVRGRNNKLTRDLQRRINRKFSQSESQQLINDLASGKRTELTELLAYSELLDVQPVAKSEVPIGYMQHPNGRVFYMLKTFMLKRFDVFVNETNMLKKEGKHASAMMNMVMLGTVLAMAEAGADTIKDWMAGRKTPINELVWSNLLKLAGVSRYHYYNFINSKPSQAILKMLVPPFDYVDDPVSDLRFLHKRLDKYKNTREPAKYAWRDFKKRGANWVRHIPVFGKHLYWMDKDSEFAEIIKEYAPLMSPSAGTVKLEKRLKAQRNK